jgi:RNA polymerase sigma factor (sigma-70 family)
VSSVESQITPMVEQISRYEHDRLLLQKFVATRSEEAFAALFHRYHAFVTSVCLREVRDPELAADAAQIVFIALMHKASAIRRGTALSAWLFQAARFAARDLARKERCRMTREQSVADEQARRLNLQSAAWEEEAWQRVDPVLNQALLRLNSAERLVILLRYFDGLSLRECALALGLTSDSARMRITRALGKMRRQLERSGIALSVAALAALLSRHAEAAATQAAIPVIAPSLCGIAPPIHVQAAKGVLFKMNVLLWKPVIVGALAVGAALSVPVIAPHANASFHANVSSRGNAPYSTPARSEQSATVATNGPLLSDLYTVLGTDSLAHAVTVSKRQVQGDAQGRPRKASPSASDPSVADTPAQPGIDLLSVRRSIPADELPVEARTLLQQLARQTVDEAASSRTKQILTSVRSLQKTYTTSGRLDEAVSVRDAIADFKLHMAGVLPDPGNLISYRENVGRSYVFSVVGSTKGPELNGNRLELLDDFSRSSVLLGGTLDSTNLTRGLGGESSEKLDASAVETTPRLSVTQPDRAVAFSRVFTLSRAATTIWGTDIYTDDSPLAAVAVHSGLLREGEKGVLKVTIFAGRDDYEGSTRNGVASSAYGSWDGSYMVERAPGFDGAKPAKLPAEARTLITALGSPASAGEEEFSLTLESLRKLKTSAEQAAKLDEALVLRDAVATIIAGRVGAKPDPGSLTEYRGQNGRQISFQVTGRTGGSIWGSDTYTDDSDIGTAAVHAGLLKPGQTGIVQVTILPGLASYTGTRRNGVTTSAYAEWTGSYRMELVTLY